MEEGKKVQILERIMIEYGSDLVRLAFSYVKDTETAKDMVQNTFIKCYENLDRFRFESSIKTWLYRITINQCKDYLRSWHYRKVQARSFLEKAVGTLLPSAEEKVMNKTEAEEMKRMIFSLSKQYREVIFLYYYKSFSIKEISEITGLNTNTVKTRLRRAKQKLKILIEEGDVYES